VCKSGIECRKLGVGARLALTSKRDSLLCEVHGPTFLEGATLAPWLTRLEGMYSYSTADVIRVSIPLVDGAFPL
jgi:hypothetical protein